MQFVEWQGQHVAFRDIGPKAAPAIVMAHPLGMNQTAWDDLAARLCRDFRLVSWDLPGHGGSGPAAGPLSAADLARQVTSLLDALDIPRAHFVGTSIGGLIGQALLLDAPGRVDHVALTNTSAMIGQPESWRQRAAKVRERGLPALATELVERWFGPAFKAGHPAAVHGWETQLSRGDGESYARLCELLAAADFRNRLGSVAPHVELLAGAEDHAAPPATVQALADELPHATLATLGGAGHVPPVESPDAFASWLRGALANDRSERPPGFEDGLATRRQILGNDHVDRATRNVTTLDAPFQNMITRLAWGELWANPDLTRRERSLVTLAILAALGRDGEFELHLETAKRLGVAEAELRQALMHVAIYAGVPAANHAFKLAKAHGWGTARGDD